MKRKLFQLTSRTSALQGLFGAFTLLVVGSAHAADVQPCREIQWQPYQLYTVTASLHQRTHIILPEPIQGKPVPGSPQLWDVDGENIHLFIKPKNFGNNEGGTTTVTAVSKSNTSYDFLVKRVKTGADICVRIVAEQGIDGGELMGWESRVERENGALRNQLSFQRKQVQAAQAAGEQATLDALHAYRKQIYTRYSWKGGKSFFNESNVTDVWDDGRWTYVRINTDNKGLMQITAIVQDKEELIEYDYDSDQLVYQLAGLYPEFVLRYNKAKITVTRQDSATSGAY